MIFCRHPTGPRVRVPSVVKIDDLDVPSSRFASRVVATTRVRLLVVLSPPLLAELAARRLAPLDVLVVIAAEGTPVPAGHYDVVVRNVTLPAGVSADLVVDLPSPAGSPPQGTPVGELVTLDRLEEVADLLADRWPVPGS
jgi:hypothetical protein